MGKKSNNGVEWLALIKGLEIANSCGMEELAVYGDSLMVIREEILLYKKRNIPLTKIHHILIYIGMEFTSLNFFHILRTSNK